MFILLLCVKKYSIFIIYIHKHCYAMHMLTNSMLFGVEVNNILSKSTIHQITDRSPTKHHTLHWYTVSWPHFCFSLADFAYFFCFHTVIFHKLSKNFDRVAVWCDRIHSQYNPMCCTSSDQTDRHSNGTVISLKVEFWLQHCIFLASKLTTSFCGWFKYL